MSGVKRNSGKSSRLKEKKELKQVVKTLLLGNSKRKDDSLDSQWDMKTTLHQVHGKSNEWQGSMDQLRLRFQYIQTKHILVGVMLALMVFISWVSLSGSSQNHAHNAGELSAKTESYISKQDRKNALQHEKKANFKTKSSLQNNATRVKKKDFDRKALKAKNIGKKTVKPQRSDK